MTWLGKLVSSMKVHKQFYIKVETAEVVTLSVMPSAVYMVCFFRYKVKYLSLTY